VARGDVVLEPLDMSIDALPWQAAVLASVVCDGFRVAPPHRTREGELVVDGWTAWPLLEGTYAPRWADILAVGERFHRALAGVERPAPVLDARTDVWARVDRIACGEQPAGRFERVPEVAHLLAARTTVSAPSQLIHGDLSGNVLFADGMPPAASTFRLTGGRWGTHRRS
jgi:prepilin-type processing-associated H-X9-DG protein